MQLSRTLIAQGKTSAAEAKRLLKCLHPEFFIIASEATTSLGGWYSTFNSPNSFLSDDASAFLDFFRLKN
jgi:hypothetical protein